MSFEKWLMEKMAEEAESPEEAAFNKQMTSAMYNSGSQSVENPVVPRAVDAHKIIERLVSGDVGSSATGVPEPIQALLQSAESYGKGASKWVNDMVLNNPAIAALIAGGTGVGGLAALRAARGGEQKSGMRERLMGLLAKLRGR